MNGSALVSINMLIEACYIDSIELYLAIKKYKNIICRIIAVTKDDHIKQIILKCCVFSSRCVSIFYTGI